MLGNGEIGHVDGLQPGRLNGGHLWGRPAVVTARRQR
jgi:hypothetical protein